MDRLRSPTPIATLCPGATISPSCKPLRFVASASPHPPMSFDGAALDVVVSLRLGLASGGDGDCGFGLWRPPAFPGGDGLLVAWRPGRRHDPSPPRTRDRPRLSCVHASTLEEALVAAENRNGALASGWPEDDGDASASTCARTLRVFFDGSAVEAFTCCGAALATRSYRGGGGRARAGECGAAASEAVALHLVALGGEATVVTANAWGMCSVWGGG